MFEIVMTSFKIKDKLGKTRFFQDTFILADINLKVVLEMLFLTLRNGDIQFFEKELLGGLILSSTLCQLPSKLNLLTRRNLLGLRLMKILKPLWYI